MLEKQTTKNIKKQGMLGIVELSTKKRKRLQLHIHKNALLATTRKVRDIFRVCQNGGNLLTSLNPSQFNVSLSSLLESLTNKIRSLTFALRTDDCGHFLLLGFFDNEASAFSFLLGDLFLFNGVCEVAAKGEVGLRGDC